MKNRVNLYSANYQPKLELVSLNFTIAMVVMAIVTVVAMYLPNQYELQSLQNDFKSVSAEENRYNQQLQQLSAKVSGRQQDPKLIAQVNALNEAVGLKQKLLDNLSDRETLKTQGFATFMSELAQQPSEQIWLTHIMLDEGQMQFRGKTAQAEAVPQWVAQLSSTDYFANKQFASARLFRDEQDVMHFSLSSSLNDLGAPSE